LGTVSGTDETPLALYEPTHAIRVYLENPTTVNTATVNQVGVTSITASGTTTSGSVSLQGIGTVSLHTNGLPTNGTITISGGLRLQETDGSPDFFAHTIVVTTGSLTNLGGGVAQLNTGGGGGGGGVTAHSELTGLSADDHTQYSLVNGARAFTGTVGGITPTSASHLATKGYVDGSHKAITGDAFISVTSGTNAIRLSADAIVGDSFISVVTGTNVVSLSADSIVGTSNNVTVISGTSAVTVSGVTTVSSGIAYINDPTRGGKALSVSRQNYPFSYDGLADGTFLAAGYAVNTDAGWLIPRDATIVSYTAYFPSGPAGKTFQVRKNNSAVTLSTLSISAGQIYYNDQVNIDLNRGDRLQVFVDSALLGAQDPTFMIEVAWRLA
jgi:hypothetical protein